MLTNNEKRLKDLYERQTREGASGWFEMKLRSVFRGAAAVAIVGAIGSVAVCSLTDEKSGYVASTPNSKTNKIDSSIPERLRIAMMRGDTSVINYPNGNKWEGEVHLSWLDNNPDGYGKYTWKDGSYFIGSFHKDLPGEYIPGKSFGFMQFRNGIQYLGEFYSYERHGYGMMAWPDGKRFTGIFQGGKPVEGNYSNDGLIIDSHTRFSYELEQKLKFELYKQKGSFKAIKYPNATWEGEVNNEHPWGFGRWIDNTSIVYVEFFNVTPAIKCHEYSNGQTYIGESSWYPNQKPTDEFLAPDGYGLLKDANQNIFYAGKFAHGMIAEEFERQWAQQKLNSSRSSASNLEQASPR
ncbi:MAG: hypothetical protein WBK55_04425 [Alphaproteobacteria bacterium]